MMQTDKSATLSTHNTQTLFDPIPIADKATRYKGGGDTRNNDGSANGLGIGEPGAPANTLTAADRHGVACFAQQAIGEYEESEKASCLKRRDYKDRGDIVKDFQTNPETMVFLAQIDTAGLGITLTAADTCVYYSVNFNYAAYSQSLARIHRIGQKNACTYIHLITEGTIDEVVLKALAKKEDLAKTVVDTWRDYF